MNSRFIKYGFVLTLIAVICSGILAYVNLLTKDKIAQIIIKKENKARKSVLSVATNFDKSKAKIIDEFCFIPGYDKDGKRVGYVVSIDSPGYVDNINFVIGIGNDSKLTGLKIVNAKETPGLGSKIKTDEKWINHWKEEGALEEFDKSVDAFAGATISPRAVYTGVIEALESYEKIQN